MKIFRPIAVSLALGALTLVGCGGGGAGSLPQVFPAGFYVSFDSTFKLSYMSDFAGANWNKQDTPNGVQGFCFDKSGNLIAAIPATNRIVKFTNPADLSVFDSLGTLGSSTLEFNNPTDVAIDSAGKIYVADSGNKRIVRMDNFSGAGWTTLDVSSASNQANETMDLAIDKNDKIYVVFRMATKILRADNMSDSSFEFYATNLSLPNDIQVDGSGRIYVCDSGNTRIARMDDMTGTNRVNFGTQGTGTNQFQVPMGIGLDALGRIYVLDRDNARICRFDDMTGTNWTTFGSNGNGTGQFVGGGTCDLFVKL